MEKELSPDARRRRNELLIIGIISVLIIILTTIEMKIPQFGGMIPIGNNIIVFSLININIILILLLIFLVIRNLVKLIFERKRKVLGAKLRTKLVVAFISLSLVPTILLFFVAAGFITNSVEHWFKVQVEQSLQGSLEVVQTYYRDFANNAVSSAQQIGRHVSALESFKGGKGSTLLRKELEAKRKEYNLSTLGIYSRRKGGDGEGGGSVPERHFLLSAKRSLGGRVFRKRGFQNLASWRRGGHYGDRPHHQFFRKEGSHWCGGRLLLHSQEPDHQDA